MPPRFAPFDMIVRSMDPRCHFFRDPMSRAAYFLDVAAAVVEQNALKVSIGEVDIASGRAEFLGTDSELGRARGLINEALYRESCAFQRVVAHAEHYRIARAESGLSRDDISERAWSFAADAVPVFASDVDSFGDFQPSQNRGWTPLIARHCPHVFRAAGIDPIGGNCFGAASVSALREESLIEWAMRRAREVTAHVGGSARLIPAAGPR